MGRKSRRKKKRRKKPKRKNTRRKRGGMKIPFMRDVCFQKCPYGSRRGTPPIARGDELRTCGDCFHQCAATMMNSDEFYERAHPSVKIERMAGLYLQGPQKISLVGGAANLDSLMRTLVSLYVEIPPGSSKMVIITKNHAVSQSPLGPWAGEWMRPFWFEYPLNREFPPPRHMRPRFIAGGMRMWHVVIMARDNEDNLFLIDPKHRVISSNSDIIVRPWLNKFCPDDGFWAPPAPGYVPDVCNEACHWGNDDFFRLHHWDGIQFRTVDNAENNNDKTGFIDNEEERHKILLMFRKDSLFKCIFFPDEDEPDEGERVRGFWDEEHAERERVFLNSDTYEKERARRERTFLGRVLEDEMHLKILREHPPERHDGWVFNENDAAKINLIAGQEGVIPGDMLQEKWKYDAKRRVRFMSFFAQDDARRLRGAPLIPRRARQPRFGRRPQGAAATAAATLV